MTNTARLLHVLALAVSAFFFVQCKAKEDDFFAKTFSCDSRAVNSCGTDRSGAPLTCFPASRYGGTDFCAPACDPAREDTRFTCQDDAWLELCDPTSPSSPCPRGFTCRPTGPGRGLCVLPCSAGGPCVPSPGQSEAGPDAPPEASAPSDAAPEADAPADTADTGDIVLCAGSNDACRGVGDGGPMVCVNSSSLGGQDFCAEACTPGAPVDDPMNYRCTDMGALLRRCEPSSSTDPRADCPQGLNCFRTNLMANEGVCMKMPVCSKTEPCPGPRICAAALFGDSSAPLMPSLDLDHLNCIISQCTSRKATCGDGEGCLGPHYASALADLCVPRCSNGSCPPNFSCASEVSGMGSQALCVPGIPGAPCGGSNCLLGGCEATNAGFSVCTKACSSDEECAPFEISGDPFVCVDWGDADPHCVTSRPFNGAPCKYNSQCSAAMNQFCSQVDQFGSNIDPGECRVPCKSDGTCDPLGGLPFTCLLGAAGGCYPGTLGLACKLASECMRGLTCQDVEPELDLDAGAARNLHICTASCAVDGGTDADGDPLCNDPMSIVQGGYCARGTCRLRRVAGQPCDRDPQCVVSAHCDTGIHQCVVGPAQPTGL